MEGIKISQLPPTAALAGSERLPLVQSGQTRAVTVAQLREGLLTSGHAGSGGDTHPAAIAGGVSGFLSGADKSKLDEIQAGATVNSADSHLLNRANHSGSQEIETVTGLQAALNTKAPANNPAFTGAVSIGTTTYSSALCVAGVNLNVPVVNGVHLGVADNFASVEMAGPVGAFVDFTTPGSDYKGRIIYRHESGTMTLCAGSAEKLHIDSNGTMRPASDGVQPNGSGSSRWSELYAVTGTINTSDERDKEAIAAVNPTLSAALLRAFDPVTYKWRDIDQPETVERRQVLRQKTEPATVVESIIEHRDGLYVRRQIERTIECPHFIEHPLHDEAGRLLMDAEGRPVLHREPVMEEVEEQVVTSPACRKANYRTHWGFVAQQVEQALCDTLGLDRDAARLRFAGLVHDNEADRYGLRESQFIPILWSVLRNLLDRVEMLEAERPAA